MSKKDTLSPETQPATATATETATETETKTLSFPQMANQLIHSSKQLAESVVKEVGPDESSQSETNYLFFNTNLFYWKYSTLKTNCQI